MNYCQISKAKKLYSTQIHRFVLRSFEIAAKKSKATEEELARLSCSVASNKFLISVTEAVEKFKPASGTAFQIDTGWIEGQRVSYKNKPLEQVYIFLYSTSPLLDI